MDIYFRFNYFPNEQIFLLNSVTSVTRTIAKFLSVRWLGMVICIERVIKLFPSLQSHCLSLKTNEKAGMEFAPRNNRLIAAFKHPFLFYNTINHKQVLTRYYNCYYNYYNYYNITYCYLGSYKNAMLEQKLME